MAVEAELNATIDRLNRKFPHLSETMVPAGITRHWLLTLDIAPSVFDETPYSTASSLPDRIRLRDDLILTRNLLRSWTEEELLERILVLPRIPGDLEAVNAPDLQAALELLVTRVTQANKLLSTELSVDDERAQILIEIHPVFGAFREFSELIVGVILYRIIRSFLAFSNEPKRKLGSIEIQAISLGKNPRRMLQDAVEASLTCSKKAAKVIFPAKFLNSPNPNYDPQLWATLARKANNERRFRKRVFSVAAVKEEILHSLRERSTTHNLPELARSFSMSDRTFLRRMANEQVTLRSIVVEARHQLAKEMLMEKSISIKYISRKLGYSDASSFVRSFNKLNGITPDRWRSENFHE